MKKPAWTETVERGMWLIVARSPTVMAAEESGYDMTKAERDAILSAVRYADYHWSKHKGWSNADVPSARVVSRKRKSAGQQAAGEAKGRVPSDMERPSREVEGMASSPGDSDVAGA